MAMPNGSLTVAKTNTAAVVRSTGGYIIGPTISGKQAHIFTDGTNTFQVDVNSFTNNLTAYPTNITDGVTSGTYSEATRTFDISAITGKAITNGASEAIIAGLRIKNGSIVSDTDPNLSAYTPFGGYFVLKSDLCSTLGGHYDYCPYNSYGKESGSSDIYAGYSHKQGPLVFRVLHNGSIMTSNNITAHGTNTAASFTTPGTVSAASVILPHLGTNTTISLIFTNGTLQAWEIAQ